MFFPKFKLIWQICLFCRVCQTFLTNLPQLPKLPNPSKIKNPLNTLKLNFYFILEYLNSNLEYFEISLRYLVQRVNFLARLGKLRILDR